jgi:preprotein translocase subunit SecB
MIPSPLHLETYFFTEIHLVACSADCETQGDGMFTSQVECARHGDDPSKWMVQLGVRKAEDDEEGCPEYTFEIQVVGLFDVDKEYPSQKAESMVKANGPAVLFGAVREMVANLTARGPFPPVELPTVTFVDECKSSEKSAKPKSRRPRPRLASKKVTRSIE